MTREEYSQHKEDYDNRQLSGGAFVLFQETYIATIEAHLKAKDEEIERLKEELKYYQEQSKNNAIIGNLFLDL